jgi:hypothetical protein
MDPYLECCSLEVELFCWTTSCKSYERGGMEVPDHLLLHIQTSVDGFQSRAEGG